MLSAVTGNNGVELQANSEEINIIRWLIEKLRYDRFKIEDGTIQIPKKLKYGCLVATGWR